MLFLSLRDQKLKRKLIEKFKDNSNGGDQTQGWCLRTLEVIGNKVPMVVLVEGRQCGHFYDEILEKNLEQILKFSTAFFMKQRQLVYRGHQSV